VGVHLFHAERQADGRKDTAQLTVDFRNWLQKRLEDECMYLWQWIYWQKIEIGTSKTWRWILQLRYSVLFLKENTTAVKRAALLLCVSEIPRLDRPRFLRYLEDFSQSFQTNSGIMPQTRPRPILSKPFANYPTIFVLK
jgi:hypothetical protein